MGARSRGCSRGVQGWGYLGDERPAPITAERAGEATAGRRVYTAIW